MSPLDTAHDAVTYPLYPADKCIHELFEEQATKTPDAIAVEYEDERRTYAELNAQANRLAHYLRGIGVGPEVWVGLCVARSVEMVLGLDRRILEDSAVESLIQRLDSILGAIVAHPDAPMGTLASPSDAQRIA
jgi:non-ribosomal peptide synthetase component F